MQLKAQTDLLNELQQELAELKSNTRKLEEQNNHWKNKFENLELQLQSKVDRLQEELHTLQQQVQEIQEDIAENARRSRRGLPPEEEWKRIASDLDELWDVLEEKADLANLRDMIAKSEKRIRILLDQKADVDDVRDALATKADVDVVDDILAKKLDYSEALKLIQESQSSKVNDQTQQALEQLKKELLLKASIKDVCTLLDTKVDVETNPVARFLWNSRNTKAGNGVPWNIQIVNSEPLNFIWEKDKANIVVKM